MWLESSRLNENLLRLVFDFFHEALETLLYLSVRVDVDTVQ